MTLPVYGAAGTRLVYASGLTAAAVPVPAGVTSDQIVLVHIYFDDIASAGTMTVTAPAGFTEITPAPDTTTDVSAQRVWWKRTTGVDAGTYTFTWVGLAGREAVATRYTGGSPSGTPVDVADWSSRSTNGTVTPAVVVTTTGPDRLLVWSGTAYGASAWTPPAGYTERVDGGEALTVATLGQAVAGSSGSITGTGTASAVQTARLIALLPAASAPTVSAGADAETQINTVFARTATEADNGAAISARAWTINSGTGAGSTIGTAAALSWTPSTAGVRVLRYSATNAAGTTTDDVTVTVVAKPTVSAGADVTHDFGTTFARTATENANGFTISARSWVIVSGPVTGTIGSAAALSWTPTVAGAYVLRYTATNSQGSTADDVTVTVACRVLRGSFAAAYLQVQAAFGADLTADDDTWTWHDITPDVRQSDGSTVSWTMGQADEADGAQPAQCSILLDNRTGDYSLGGQSQWWPYIRRNTPIRVRLDPSTGTFVDLFRGDAVGWTPDWDLTGVDATVQLECAGTLRRLNQSQTAIPSTYQTIMERDITAGRVVAYWPMTESTLAAATVSQFREVVGGQGRYGMEWIVLDDRTDHKAPELAADNTFGASEPLPTLSGVELVGDVPRYTPDSQAAVRMLIKFPDSGAVPGQQILFCELSGSSDTVEIQYGPAVGRLTVLAERGARENTTFSLNVDGGAFVLQLEMVESGGTVSYALTLVPVNEGPNPTATVSTGNWSGTIGRISQVWVNTHPDEVDDGVAPAEVIVPGAQDWVAGHVAVYKTITEDYHLDELTGWEREQAVARVQRLATEAGVPLTVVDADDPNDPRPQESDLMGPQFADDLLPLLGDAAEVDGGILYDGRDFGLTYVTRRYGYSRTPADLTLDVAQSQLLEPFSSADDDQATANRITVKRDGGIEQIAEDVDGPLGTAAVGFYDKSATLNLYSDAGALLHAQWRVHLGTVGAETYRYPTVAFNLAKCPELAGDWVATEIGGRVDVTNLLDARTQLPGDTQSLLLQGFTQQIDQTQWTAVLNCTPYEPYRVVVVASSTADSGEHTGRADTEGSTLNSAMAVGATSISVATTSGPLWTTAAAQYPQVLDVGGIPVTATACSGASSPQTFTVTGATVTTAKAAGIRVQVWQPAVLGL